MANFGASTFFVSLLLLLVRHRSKQSSKAISRNTDEPDLTKWKTNFGPDFGLFCFNLSLKLCVCVCVCVCVCFTSTRCYTAAMMLSLYATSRKTNDVDSRKWQKNPSFWASLKPTKCKFGFLFFFFFQKSNFISH